jgi:hypothetical protein
MSLLNAIKNSQDCDTTEAKAIFAEMVEEVENGRDPEDVLYDWGLEPDYVFDLLDAIAG